MRKDETLAQCTKDLKWIYRALKRGKITPLEAREMTRINNVVVKGANDSRRHRIDRGDTDKMPFYYD